MQKLHTLVAIKPCSNQQIWGAISFALLLLIDELLWMIIGRTPSCYMSVHELRLLSFITSVRAWARSRRGAGEVNEFAICSTSGAAKIQLCQQIFSNHDKSAEEQPLKLLESALDSPTNL